MHVQGFVSRPAALDPVHCMAAGGLFLLWECSTPFVFVRWGLHALGRADTKLYLYNGLTMMAVFCICRNVMGVGEATP